MTSLTDFEDLDIVVHRRKGHFLAKIPQISLYATGQTLHEAIDNLEKKKRDLLAELQAVDCLDDITIAPPASYSFGLNRRGAASGYRGALTFAGKVALVAIALMIAGSVVSRQIRTTADRFSQMGGASFWGNFQTQLARAADPSTDLPPARKQQLLSEIRVVVERWRPFVHEATLLFADPGPAPSPVSASVPAAAPASK